ncbi:MAG: tetratricopeptide repeat protein [Deltaproteobacteria bacterium]|nr:tetratricopeptide repeat protein [Deltaproteobacteria bacterium]MBW2020958.1 tetratricopeptide repeat protein [Deltaproteobacteria bacterium]
MLEDIDAFQAQLREEDKEEIYEQAFKSLKERILRFQDTLADRLEKEQTILSVLNYIVEQEKTNTERQQKSKLKREIAWHLRLINTYSNKIHRLKEELRNKERGLYLNYYLKEGKRFFEKEQYEKALDSWEQVLKLSPDNAYVHGKLQEIIES